MTISLFPGCCGTIILHGFGNTGVASDTYSYPIEEIEKFLIEKALYWKANGSALLVVTLNKEQLTMMAKTFKKLGWNITNEEGHKHPKHRTEIYLLTKRLQE